MAYQLLIGYHILFVLVSLALKYGISTLVGYLMPKSIIAEKTVMVLFNPLLGT